MIENAIMAAVPFAHPNAIVLPLAAEEIAWHSNLEKAMALFDL